MKKILFILFFVVSCFLLYERKIENKEVLKEPFKEEYIEVVPEHAKAFLLDNNDVVLTEEKIKEYNQKIRTKTDAFYDLNYIYTKQDLLHMINKYVPPKLPKYDGDKEVTQEMVESMLQNRNLEQIHDELTLQKGIVVNRTNLKSFPTYTHFFEKRGVFNFDVLQEAEVTVATPLLILHESLDQKWVFVVTEIYAGWVEKKDVAYAEDELYTYFANPSSFGIITNPRIEIQNTQLDMGVKLPYLGVLEDEYEFAFPSKGKNGYLETTTITLKRNEAHIGYLPYTKNQVIIQALKYEDFQYRWGGMDDGIDCSSYVLNVYKTFGFIFPRNTSDQKNSIGEILLLEDKTEIEKVNEIKKAIPSLLYMPGHVTIYIGNDSIIHASGTELKVTLNRLEDTSYLSRIDRLIVIE